MIVDRVASLLARTSRTFALTIPYLPEPVQREVALAYLILRIADTLEDATQWTTIERVTALKAFGAWLDEASPEAAQELVRPWQQAPPCAEADYRELLQALPEIAIEVQQLDSTARTVILRHCQRTTVGMAELVGLVPTDVAGLQRYCYVVAGIVGEMLTALFLPRLTLTTAQRERLQALAVPFGEGLQLVNILKDALTDDAEGRRFLPNAVPATDVFALAMANLDAAKAYATTLAEAGAPRGFLLFTRLPVALAEATLARVHERGPGAKLTRAEVAQWQHDLEAEYREP